MSKRRKKRSPLKGIVTACVIMMLISVTAVALLSIYVMRGGLAPGTSSESPARSAAAADDSDIPMLYDEPGPDDRAEPAADSASSDGAEAPAASAADEDSSDDSDSQSTMRPYGYYDSIGETPEEANKKAVSNYDPNASERFKRDLGAPDIIGTISGLEARINPDLYIHLPISPNSQEQDGGSGSQSAEGRSQSRTFPKYSDLGRPVKVATIGDSITAGAGLSNPASQSYPACLQQLLGSDYQVTNFGHGGASATSRGMLPYKTLPEYQNAISYNADIYIIMLGSNDAYIPIWSPEAYVREMSGMAQTFMGLSGSPRVIFMTPPKCFVINNPVEPEKQLYNSIIQDEICPAVRGIARSLGLVLIDMYSFTSTHPDWFPDTLHPDAVGSYQMADLVSIAIRNN